MPYSLYVQTVLPFLIEWLTFNSKDIKVFIVHVYVWVKMYLSGGNSTTAMILLWIYFWKKKPYTFYFQEPRHFTSFSTWSPAVIASYIPTTFTLSSPRRSTTRPWVTLSWAGTARPSIYLKLSFTSEKNFSQPPI